MNTLGENTEKFNIEKFIQTIDGASFAGEILCDVDLSQKTTMKVGGKASAFFVPHTKESFSNLLVLAKEQKIPFFILGGGSNLVVGDKGIDVPVISTEKLKKISCKVQDDALFLACEAGTTIEEITQFCIENALSGFEYFAGLPGSIGGALYMNARCYEHSISELVQSVSFIDVLQDGYEKVYIKKDEDWAYKVSPFQKLGTVILEGTFRVQKGNKDEIKQKSDFYIQDRKTKGHFKFPSAGSVFKNNHLYGKSSGKIIDEVGLKGMKLGGAEVASWHGNFIINSGNARACDIYNLVVSVIEKVREKTNFMLEPEIIFTDIMIESIKKELFKYEEEDSVPYDFDCKKGI